MPYLEPSRDVIVVDRDGPRLLLPTAAFASITLTTVALSDSSTPDFDLLDAYAAPYGRNVKRRQRQDGYPATPVVAKVPTACRGHGRNLPCPCGSGVKQKRCCGGKYGRHGKVS